MIGRTLSHYEITAKLGEGGMSEVWRARLVQVEILEDRLGESLGVILFGPLEIRLARLHDNGRRA